MLEPGHAGAREPALPAAAVEAGGVAIHPLLPCGRFALRLRPAVAEALGTVAGFDLALAINRRGPEGGRVAARLGPDEWALAAPEAEADLAVREVERALSNHLHALVDVSHRDVGLAVEGAGAADALNAGCPLDLHASAFPAGTMTRTLLGKAEILLARPGAAPRFEVTCWRSFAPYVRDFLAEAARSL